MKPLFTLLLLLSGITLFAQSNEKIYGNWVKVRTIYKDGTELYDNDLSKYSYTKLVLAKPNKCTIVLKYDQWGGAVRFSVSADILQFETAKGFIMNQLRIEKLTADTMVLVQQNNDSWDDPACVKLYYVPEGAFQKAEKLTAEDVVRVRDKDTLFNASEKVYANFNSETSFHQLEQTSLGDLHSEAPIKTRFFATFIIDKNGVADSLKIIEGVNPDFDKQYIKTFSKYKTRWIAPIRNGKPVSVQMKDEFRFGTFAPDMLGQMSPGPNADAAMKRGDYDLAIINYTKALKFTSYVGEYYYKRAFCYLAKGNATDACTDLQKAKELGTYSANGLIKRFCK
jgi:tetratricopeptide (TPR) repeat protein